MRHSKLKFTLLGTLALVGCGDTGPEGVPATAMTVATNSAFTWPGLCKRVTVSFFDSSSVAHRWGRDEALRLTLTNGTPYASATCTDSAINNVYLGPENTTATFWVKTTTTGTVSISVSGGGFGNTVDITSESPTAKLVLGQANFTTGTANRGTGTNNNTMSAPSGIVVCGTKLFVADRSNNRVLGWNTLPTSNGQAVSFVLGQGAVTTSGTGTSSTTMNGPAGVACSSNTLYVADSGNRRILGFSPIPSANTAASFVWGAADLNSQGAASATQTGDSGSALQIFGNALIAANPFYHRILVWNTAPTSTGTVATGLPDYVIGQTSFTTGATGTGLASLNSVSGARMRDGYLMAADLLNHRALIYPTPLSTGMSASIRLGRSDATSGFGGSELNNPNGVDYDGDHFIVADTGNSRMLIWNGLPTTSGQSASLAIGALSDFSSAGSGSATQNEGQFAQFWIDGAYMWVSDYNLNRVVAYPAP
jgi:hypothetical protein